MIAAHLSLSIDIFLLLPFAAAAGPHDPVQRTVISAVMTLLDAGR
jgi:hypothetical protein